MTHKSLLSLTAVACGLFLAMPVSAADKPAKSVTTAAKASKTAHKAMGPETLTGKLMKIDPAAKLVIVQDPAGTPFDMRVTKRTHIEAGGQSIKLKDLSKDANKSVSVRFIPEHRGDVAKSIQVTG